MNLDTMAVEYIYRPTLLYNPPTFPHNFNLAQVHPLNIKFPSQETRQIKQCTCIILRKKLRVDYK